MFTVIAHKTCSVVRPTFDDVLESFKDLVRKVDLDSYAEASKDHIRVLTWLGLDTTFVKVIHETYRDLRVEILANPRSSSEDLQRLTEKAEVFVEKVDLFINSQKGLENFKTDQSKMSDPFYADFYYIHSEFGKAAMRTATDAEFALLYHSEGAANGFTAFTMVIDRISQRAIASE